MVLVSFVLFCLSLEITAWKTFWVQRVTREALHYSEKLPSVTKEVNGQQKKALLFHCTGSVLNIDLRVQ